MAKIIKFLLFILLILAILYGYTLYKDLPLKKENLSIIYKRDLPIDPDTSSTLVQFSPNMRFATDNLSYFFEDDCLLNQRDSVTRALEILSERTGELAFYELTDITEEPKITIACSERSKEADREKNNSRTFIAGEGGPTKFLNLTPYSLILQGEIQLYRLKYNPQCEEPLVEVHELLHVFGYNHINDEKSILYPYLSCDQELTQDILEDMRRLYREEAKAELSIENISASKAGKYLNFYIEIKNSGLINTEDVSLEISSEGRLVKTVEIESLSPGLLRSLEMKNLVLSSSKADSVRFTVKTAVPEYSKENNVVQMVVG